MRQIICDWCRRDIPATTRRDATVCSKSCRQARWRFVHGLGRPPSTASVTPLRIAYADPPYPGKSARYYGKHPDFGGEVDHAALVDQLTTYDTWALSTSSDALPRVLRLCPDGVSIAAWHRGARVTPGVIATGWEPVIYFGSRHVVADPRDTSDTYVAQRRDTLTRHDASPRTGDDASSAAEDDMSHLVDATYDAHRVDSLVYRPGVRRTDPSRVVGAKPAAFAGWLFRLLGALPGDTLDDLYPGSGGISRAWSHWTTPTKERTR